MSIKVSHVWGHSSAGRAPALQAGGQRFDPAWLHQNRLEKSRTDVIRYVVPQRTSEEVEEAAE